MLLLLLACAPPFDVTRKDLGPFRIAAVGVQDGVADAVIWSGEGMAHATAPQLDWSLDGEPLGSGWDVQVPQDSGVLELVATHADGHVETAQVPVAPTPDAPTWTRERVLLDSVELEDRRDAQAQAGDSAALDEAVRLTLDGAFIQARWMSADGVGTVLELQTLAADVVADEITFESSEGEFFVAERLPGKAGVTHHLVLLLDGQGGNRWVWLDAAFGVDGELARHGGRLLPVDAALEPGLYATTLDAAGAPGALDPVSDLSEQDVDCGVAEVPFELDWLAQGRCGLDQVEGARVVLEIQ
jgi:hypothetical protein